MSITDKLQTLKNTKQAIKQALIDKGVEVSDSDDFASYADKITNFPADNVETSIIAGLTAENFVGVDSNNKLVVSDTNFVCTASNIGDNVLYYKNYNNKGIKSVSFPNLTDITGRNAMYNAFLKCENNISVEFPNLVNASATESMYGCFSENSNLNSFDFSNLTSIGYYALRQIFYKCPKITLANFPKLISIGFGGLYMSFYNTAITSFYAPNLTTVNYQSLYFALPENVTILDFPKLSGTIKGLTFGNNKGLKKFWLPKNVTKIITLDAFDRNNSYSNSPFYNCSTDLIIYTDAPERLEDWSEYCFYVSATQEATVVYGATHEDFENDNTNPSGSSSGGNGGFDNGGDTDPEPNRN